MKDRSHDEAIAERFRVDPTYAAELLAGIRRNANLAELAILSWPSGRMQGKMRLM